MPAPTTCARSLLILALSEICAGVQFQFNFQNLRCYCKPSESSTDHPSPSPGHSTYHPYRGSCYQDLYDCDIWSGGDCYRNDKAISYTTTGDALLNCPDDDLVKITLKWDRGDMNFIRANRFKATSQMMCRNGEWWLYASIGYDRPLRHIACYQSPNWYTISKSNGTLKDIPYTASCPKNLYDCSILSVQNCYKNADALYASTSTADAFASCPHNYGYFAKIAFKDGKGDIDVIWYEANFKCINNEWKYCKDGLCRPVRHFACYFAK